MNKNLIYILIGLLGFTSLAQNQKSKPTTGPEKGSLVIVGGALKSEKIIDKFIELAGGENAKIVVIPTASGRNKYSENAGLAGKLRKMGATNISVLHTNRERIVKIRISY